MIKCSECGYENTDGLDYCDGCGAKLTAAASTGNGGGAPAGNEGAPAPEAALTPPQSEAAPVQGTAEAMPFGRDALNTLLDLADAGIRQLVEKQRAIVGHLVKFTEPK